jgi:hypothetical protein
MTYSPTATPAAVLDQHERRLDRLRSLVERAQGRAVLPQTVDQTWEKQALSARGFKRVQRCSENAIQTVWRIPVRKKRPRGFKKEAQGVQVTPLNPHICCSLDQTPGLHLQYVRECVPQRVKPALVEDFVHGVRIALVRHAVVPQGFRPEPGDDLCRLCETLQVGRAARPGRRATTGRRRAAAAAATEGVALGLRAPPAPGVITLTQPKVPEAKIRGSQ